MKEIELRALEAAAIAYNSLPKYLNEDLTKQEMAHVLLDWIDILDTIENSRSGTPFFNIISGSSPGRRKKAIMALEKDFSLTARESHILRYLANSRNVSYIAEALDISKDTVKTHKYSIFKKLNIHSSDELMRLLDSYNGTK